MRNARQLRLQADYEGVIELSKGSDVHLVVEETIGRPPDEYVVVYRCRSVERLEKGKPIYRDLHRVKIVLPAKYPAPTSPPRVSMLTPLFHPHVYRNMEVCMGSWKTSEYLEDFLIRLGALIQYDRRFLNVHDPANEDAVYWAKSNLLLLPTDYQTFGKEAPVDHETPEIESPQDWLDISDQT